MLHSVTLNKRESILSVQESSTQNPSNHAKPEKVLSGDSSPRLKSGAFSPRFCKERFFEQLKGLEWVKKISEHDGIIDLNVRQGETRIPELVNLAQRAGTRIRSVSLREPTLEDVFLQYTGRSIRDEDGGNRALMRERVRSMRRKS